MDRRAFLTTAGIGATTLGFPAVLRAQSKDPVRIGCPLPLSGPFAALAKDMDFQKRFGIPPGDCGIYSYSGVLEAARGAELAKSTAADKVAGALHQNPAYDHYKGKQWWRRCDNKAFQDLWIVRGRGPGQVKGDWGSMDIIAKVAASEELDRTCAEQGQA